MKAPFFRLIALLAFTIALPAAAAARDGTITIAIVPTVTGDSVASGTFVIGYRPVSSKATRATLTFDLSAIPAGATITSANLRVATKGTAVNQLVRIFDKNDYKKSIGQLNPGLSPTKPFVNSAGKGLTDAVKAKAKTPGARLDLYLGTTSAPANEVVYYSDGNDGDRQIYRPRLIVSWTDAAPPVARAGAELRYRGDPADMTPWRHGDPKGATVSTPLSALGLNQIFAGPVFRADEMLVIASPSAGAPPRLYGFGWNGNKRWDVELPRLNDQTATWKYLHVDEQKRVLAFRNDQTISVFDSFAASGPAKPTDKAINGLRLTTRPAVTAGGIVVYRNDTGYIQALSPSPSFRELWRSPTNVGLSSMPVLSPRPGDNLAYVMGEQPKKLSVFDAPTGESRLTPPFPPDSKLSDFADFHPALTVEGPAHDWVFLSGYSQSGGRLEGYTDFSQGDPSAWGSMKDGPVSRCVAPSQAGAIYCVQNGQLRAFEVVTGNQKCASDGPPFSATTNLVADGAGNIYFWDEKGPLFYGFDSGCKKLFGATLSRSLPALRDGEKVVDLRAGPNGVFYATSDKELLAIQPVGSDPPTALAANTRYAKSGDVALTSAIAPPQNAPVIVAASQKVTFGNFQVPAGADVTCSAGQSISFGAGFKVAKGGVLRCGIEAR